MSGRRLKSAAEQIAEQLHGDIVAGIRSGMMPGAHRLGGELGVNHKTAESALRLLERDGLLVNRGPRRGRFIDVAAEDVVQQGLRIAVLQMEPRDRGSDYMIEIMHQLEESGHVPYYAEKTLVELGMDAGRVARFIRRAGADAWVVVAGSREVLQAVTEHDVPSFALFGRRDNLPIAAAGPDKSPPFAAATRHLIKMGHRRITFIIRRHQQRPEPTPSVRAYLNELTVHGIHVGDYNLPQWDESKQGYQEILETLFRLTPPTAILTDESYQCVAALQFLARRGLRVPEDVSLISSDYDPTFAWCEPSIAHIRWDYRPVVRRIVRWAAHISQGKEDFRQTLTKAEFVAGGTVAPVSPP